MKANPAYVLVLAMFACTDRLALNDADEVGDEVGSEGGSDSTGSDSTSSDSTSSDSTSSDSTSSDSTSSDTSDTSDDSDTSPCEPVYDGWVVLDVDSTPADFAALACVEHITKDLRIDHTTVADLGFLSALTRVDGTIFLDGNDALLDLQGLDALEHVGGSLRISFNGGLIDLQGLAALHELGGLQIVSNSSLTSLDGLTGAWHLHAPTPQATTVRIAILANETLGSLDALANISSLGADLPVRIELSDNPALVGDLAGLEGIVASAIELTLFVRDNPLESLIGLEGLTHAKSIVLLGTSSQYTSLAGLDNLVSVEQELRIGECEYPSEVCPDFFQAFNHHYLASLDGLESLESVGTLMMWGNLVLTNIDALAGLQTIGDVSITENPMLPAAAVDSLLANVELLGEAVVEGNGFGNPPFCGFGPLP